jgi:hypothetical protein
LSRKSQAEAVGLAEEELVGPEVAEQAAVVAPEEQEAQGERAGLVALAEQEVKAAPEVREAPGELAEEPPGAPAAAQ